MLRSHFDPSGAVGAEREREKERFDIMGYVIYYGICDTLWDM